MTRRALLQPQWVGERFRLQRLPVSEALSPWLDIHWIVEWALPDDQTHVQQLLPYPNANLAFEAGQTALHGIASGLAERRLQERGRVHGLRFKCGGLRPWIDEPMWRWRDRQMPPWPCLPPGIDLAEAERRVLQAATLEEAVANAEHLLLAARPPIDPWVDRLDAAVREVQADSRITRAAALQERLGLSERALQRCFANYVGVTPKWVIQRARIHDALLALSSGGEAPPLADLALQLGFFDQAHFSRCFKQHTGQTPQQYAAATRR
ncbi:helix-turn-helix transcriptional regulator [Ideonella sp. DXS29W]|uniref:Helix-turn-helix transcriptional regulator n=1 Tax=Ideonella lacteola TaxID=2984193 RepID=A0ABU9BQ82_9BURK